MLTTKFFLEAEYHTIPIGRGLKVPSLFSFTRSFIPEQPTSFDDDSTRRWINFLRHSLDRTQMKWFWNIKSRISTGFIVTYVCILTPKRSRVGYPFSFAALGTLSYCAPCGAPIASVYGLSPDHFRRNFARWVSCYALFK